MYKITCTLLIVVSLLGAQEYVFSISWSDFTICKDQGFDRIQSTKYDINGSPGAPELPAVYVNYIIPSNALVKSIIITEVTSTTMSGSYFIYPSQPHHRPEDTIPWVDPDSIIYNSNNPYTGVIARMVGHGVMDGARIATIEIRPLQYRPKIRELQVVEYLRFKFDFVPTDIPENTPKMRGKYEQLVYDGMIRAIVENDHEILTRYNKPVLVEEDQLGTLLPLPSAPCVIITPSEFVDDFQDYADWVTDQGIQTIILTPATIYSSYPQGVDNAERIRMYIQDCYAFGGGTYVILGGDDYTVPVRYGIAKDQPGNPIGENDSVPCDHYFADLTGNWNCDIFGPDEYFGEMNHDNADCYSEVFVGRIPALNEEEVENWVTKVLHYEKSPGIRFDEVLWIQDIFYNPSAEQEFPPHFLQIEKDRVNADVALYAIDDGHGIVNLNCHGNIGDFTPWNSKPGGRATIYGTWLTSPGEYRAGIDWLTNLNQYFIVYGICCHTGAFDQHASAQWYPSGSDTCIADAFLGAYATNQQGGSGPYGSTACILNTRTPMNMWFALQTKFYNAVFSHLGQQDVIPSQLGASVALSKEKNAFMWSHNYDARQGFYCQNLFGSPITEVWTKTPANFFVIHPTRINVSVPTYFTVTVLGGDPPDPIQSAKVCLHKDGDIYKVGNTGANGQVTFAITPSTIGTMKVTVTRSHNMDIGYTQYIPSQTTCRVGYPSGGQSSNEQNMAPSHLCMATMPTFPHNEFHVTLGVPKHGKIEISVFDIMGAKKYKKTYEGMKPGFHKINIDNRHLPFGVYFVVVKQGVEVVKEKYILIR